MAIINLQYVFQSSHTSSCTLVGRKEKGFSQANLTGVILSILRNTFLTHQRTQFAEKITTEWLFKQT